MTTNITTAVDSLVRLINQKGKITLDQASRELGIPENIISEWATFLDQENIIHLEYKFTTPYLISKGKESKKEVIIDYDLIIRKLEVMQAHLNKTQPNSDKKIKQRKYLLKEIKRVIEKTKKKKITKEELEKLVGYYKIFERG